MSEEKTFTPRPDRDSARDSREISFDRERVPTGPKADNRVEVRNGDVEQAMRRLKKVMNREGLFREMRDRKHHVKNFERRKLLLREAISRARKAERKRLADM